MNEELTYTLNKAIIELSSKIEEQLKKLGGKYYIDLLVEQGYAIVYDSYFDDEGKYVLTAELKRMDES